MSGAEGWEVIQGNPTIYAMHKLNEINYIKIVKAKNLCVNISYTSKQLCYLILRKGEPRQDKTFLGGV